MKFHLNRLAWIIFYAFLASVFVANCFGYLDPDFGFHLRVGETIARERSVPHDQVYMWTLQGKTWVDHEWLANLFMSRLDQIGGYVTVALFFSLLPLLGLLILNRYLFKYYLKETSERFTFALIEVGAVIGCLPHFGVRLQEITFVALILLFILIDRVRHEQNTRLAYWLLPLLFFWACLHGGFLIGVTITIGWLVYELMLGDLDRKNLSRVLVWGLLGIALTFVTPYGIALYSFLSDYGSNPYYMSHIEEWRSPLRSPFRYDQLLYIFFLITMDIAVWFSLKKRPALWQLVLLIGLTLLALRSVRHFPLFAIASLLFITPLIIKPIFNSRSIPYRGVIGFITIICLSVLTFGFVSGAKLTNTPFQSYCDNYPCGAINYLKAHPELAKLKIFNDYGWGGFIIGVAPEMRLFIDGRLPQYSFHGWTLLEEYNEFFQTEKIADKLSEYNIKLILFKPAERAYTPDWLERFLFGRKEFERHNKLIDYLAAHSSEWQAVYEDKNSKIWLKK